jgi:hypothetical protein
VDSQSVNHPAVPAPDSPFAKLFHVTAPAAVDSILAHGLRANEDGQIFAITDRLVADDVAKNQVFLREYALIVIDARGITGSVELDDVGEFTKHWQRIITQPLIPPQFLRLHCRRRQVPMFTKFEKHVWRRLGFTKREIAMVREAALHNRKVVLGHLNDVEPEKEA